MDGILTEKLAGSQDFLGLRSRHKLVVEKALPLGQPALDNVLVLPRKFLLHIGFHTTE